MTLCAECDEKVAAAVSDRRKRDGESLAMVRLNASGLPRLYCGSRRTWEIVARAAGPVRSACVDALSRGRGLYIHGRAGSFKTSIAAAWLAKTIRDGAEGFYVYTPDLFTELGAIYSSKDTTSRRDVIERYAQTQCLLIDDLDKAKVSQHSAEILGSILDFRYREERRWMIVTANCSLDELAQRFADQVGESYAEPLLRRIAETTDNVPMECEP